MSWYEELDRWTVDYLPDMVYEHDVPLAKHTSFRIGGPARRMAFPRDGSQMVLLMEEAQVCGAAPLVIGNGTNLLITDYPNCGGAEMRSWCHETVANDWQKFRSSENYNKLAYHTEFPWMADGTNGEVSMNYATLNGKNQWEVLRLYTFQSFENGIYRRDAELETNRDIRYKLADIPLPNGVLRVDKVVTPAATKVRLGHYTLPEINGSPIEEEKSSKVKDAVILHNGAYRLALVPLQGWETVTASYPEGLHPVSHKCGLIMAESNVEKEKIFVTLMLWKKGKKGFTKKELSPVKDVKVSEDLNAVDITFADKSVKRVSF